jgi:hypothetical protein
MTKTPNVHSEIARLEGELKRLSLELDALRQRVDGASGPRRTRAFTAPPPPADLTPSPPVPSSAPTSQTVPAATAGRNLGRGDLGLEAEPAPTTPTPTRRQAVGDSDSTRYKFVGEPRTQRSPRRGN